MRTEVGNIAIKYSKSHEGLVKGLVEDVTGVSEKKNEALVRQLEADIVKRPTRRPERDYKAERLIKLMEIEILKPRAPDFVKPRVPDFVISLEKASRVLKLCIYRYKETINKRGWDYEGARKISRIAGIDFHVAVRALMEIRACKNRGEYLEDYKLQRTLEQVARVR